MTEPFVGPIPYAPIPEQPTFHGQCVAWTAFDVPRIWDIVSAENNPRGWEQVDGFRQLAELLVDHHRRLRMQHFHLAQAWQSPAASGFHDRVAAFAESLLSDANCAHSTAHALHNIMATYAEARAKIEPIHNQWNSVTTDWTPEWWDSAAEELNVEAQSVMVKTDEAVRDHRKRILAPELYGAWVDDGGEIIDSSSHDTVSSGTDILVPPVPGYESWPDRAAGGPTLSASSGRVTFIPAMPGQPISMLPVPPGGHLAPFGGAYILPGPGVGRGGFVVPMPQSSNSSSSSGRNRGSNGQGSPVLGPRGLIAPPGYSNARSVGSSVGIGQGMGIMPISVGSPPLAAKDQSHNPPYRRGANTVWPTAVGGPAIIDGIGGEESLTGQSSTQEEDAFKKWFAELAYPWRSEGHTNSEPHIVLRKISE